MTIYADQLISNLQAYASQEGVQLEDVEIKIVWRDIDAETDKRTMAEFPLVRHADGRLEVPPTKKCVIYAI